MEELKFSVYFDNSGISDLPKLLCASTKCSHILQRVSAGMIQVSEVHDPTVQKHMTLLQRPNVVNTVRCSKFAVSED